MFTGLIREIGKIDQVSPRGEGGGLVVSCPATAVDIRVGDSIAVDGVCLTAESVEPPRFTCFVSGESLKKTTLGSARPGHPVNIEPALRANDRMGGHMVQGHVEGVGDVVGLRAAGEWAILTVRIPEDLKTYVVPKGSIALAGVSLTVAEQRGGEIDVAVVPATLENTTLGSWKSGRRINVETDLVGRYIVSYLDAVRAGGGITLEDLKRSGF